MDREYLQKLVNDYCDNSDTNFMSVKGEDTEKLKNRPQAAVYEKHNLNGQPNQSGFDNLGAEKDSEYVGMRFFQHPFFSVCAADDPGFFEIQKEHVVGPHHKLPKDWLPEAKTVISFFLPFEKRIVESNKMDPEIPSLEWVMARVDGQQHLLNMAGYIQDKFKEEGYDAVSPQLDDMFVMHPGPNAEDGIPGYSSNWSERHVGYVAGLGTFGLMTNFISKAGCAGRLISIITNWETAPDEKDYTDWRGYCSKCKACFKKCYGNAYDENGKDHALCSQQINKVCVDFRPRYGCGKCQSGIPCEYKALL